MEEILEESSKDYGNSVKDAYSPLQSSPKTVCERRVPGNHFMSAGRTNFSNTMFQTRIFSVRTEDKSTLPLCSWFGKKAAYYE